MKCQILRIAVLLFFWASAVAQSVPCGEPLTEGSLNGVVALSNGHPKRVQDSCAGRGEFGLQYQCVEFVRRYYSQALGVDTRNWKGNAVDYFTTSQEKGLIAFDNGSVVEPAPNDILVFGSPSDAETQNGHVAIVSAVTTAFVEVVEQNWSPTGRARIGFTRTANGGFLINDRSHYKVLGWLRIPPAAPANDFLFVANQDTSTIAAFTINPETGNLVPVPGSPFPTGHIPVSIATTPNGRFLFAGTEDQPGPLMSYSINQDGSLQLNGAFAVGELTFPLLLSTEPSSQYVFLTWQSSGPSFMLGSGFDPISGILPLNYFDGGRGGNSVIADPLGRFIFSAGTDAFVTGQFLFSRPFNSATGTFSGPQIQRPADAVPVSMAVDANGKFLYVANRGLNAVSAYVISPAGGSLTPVAGSPFTSGPNGRCLVTDKAGKVLYISTEPHDIWSYTINQIDGALTFLNHFSFIGDPIGAGCLTIDPSGSYLYSTNPESGSISGFRVDPATGDLTPLAGFPVSTGGLTPLAIGSSRRP